MNFENFIQRARTGGNLVVQPRMGFGQIAPMRAGLQAVKAANATKIGTITLDSYTRVGDHESARRALDEGRDLNGFPIVAHGQAQTRAMLLGIQDEDFPIQVRHGTPLPNDVFRALIDAGADATEGGPISYCLPYSRTPLIKAIEAWRRCSELLAEENERHIIHLESFGGCMLGQLCMPSLLIAISVLEAIFFQTYGVKSVSMSYAQGTDLAQDIAAISAMRRLAGERLNIPWHVVLYTYMGVFPKTIEGATDLLSESICLAVKGGAERVIVKTPAEAHRIPTVEENVGALEHAFAYSKSEELKNRVVPPTYDGDLYTEAKGIIDSVLELDADISVAFSKAFKKGLIDVPYCLHTDNPKRARSFIDGDGTLRWLNVGGMAISNQTGGTHRDSIKPYDFLHMLSYVQEKFDRPYWGGEHSRSLGGSSVAAISGR